MRPRDGTRHSIRERNGEETREGVNGHGSVGAHSRTRVAEGARYGEAGQNGAVGVVRRSFRHHRNMTVLCGSNTTLAASSPNTGDHSAAQVLVAEDSWGGGRGAGWRGVLDCFMLCSYTRFSFWCF